MLIDGLIVANLFICLGIAWACKCRLDKTSDRVYAHVIWYYACIGTGSLFGAFGHWVFPRPEGVIIGMVLFSLSIAISFLLDMVEWKNGAPKGATKPGELLDAKGNKLPY